MFISHTPTLSIFFLYSIFLNSHISVSCYLVPTSIILRIYQSPTLLSLLFFILFISHSPPPSLATFFILHFLSDSLFSVILCPSLSFLSVSFSSSIPFHLLESLPLPFSISQHFLVLILVILFFPIPEVIYSLCYLYSQRLLILHISTGESIDIAWSWNFSRRITSHQVFKVPTIQFVNGCLCKGCGTHLKICENHSPLPDVQIDSSMMTTVHWGLSTPLRIWHQRVFLLANY